MSRPHEPEDYTIYI